MINFNIKFQFLSIIWGIWKEANPQQTNMERLTNETNLTVDNFTWHFNLSIHPSIQRALLNPPTIMHYRLDLIIFWTMLGRWRILFPSSCRHPSSLLKGEYLFFYFFVSSFAFLTNYMTLASFPIQFSTEHQIFIAYTHVDFDNNS